MSWQKDEALRKRYAALQDLFAEYYEREKANLFGPADDGALEARDRLRQLVHIVTRLEDLQTFRDSHPNDQDRINGPRWRSIPKPSIGLLFGFGKL
jgi:hypothetical protein